MVRVVRLLKLFWASRSTEGKQRHDYVPERLVAPGFMGVLQDDWKVAALMVTTLALAVWGPAINSEAQPPVAAALEVLAEQSSLMNMFIWQALYIVVLAGCIVGKLELRLRLGPKPDTRAQSFLRNALYTAFVLLGWLLFAYSDVHASGTRWDRSFHDPISAGLVLSVLGYLTAEWVSAALAILVRRVHALTGAAQHRE